MATDKSDQAGDAGPDQQATSTEPPDTSIIRSNEHAVPEAHPEAAAADDAANDAADSGTEPDSADVADRAIGSEAVDEASAQPPRVSRSEALSCPPDGPAARRNWSAIGALVGVAALLIAVATGVIGAFAYLKPRSTPSTPARLAVISAELKPGAEIQFTPEESPLDFPEGFGIRDNFVDVQLQNQGGLPELVESVEASITYAQNLVPCFGTGGEILYAKALYDLRVPTFQSQDVPTMPLHVAQKMPFEITGNAYDRLAIRIGPDRVAKDGGPWLYAVDLTLHTRTSGAVAVGRFVLLTPTSQLATLETDLQTVEPDFFQCYRDNYSAIRHATAGGGTIDPSLDGLRHRYVEAGGLRDGDDPDNYLSQGRDWTDYGGGLTCETGSAHGVPVEYGDITGDGVGDAAVGLYCGELGAGSYFRKIVLVDGILKDKQPVQLGTVLSDNELRGARAQQGPSFMGTTAGHAGILRFTLDYEDPIGSDPVFATFEFAWTGQALVPAGPTCHSDTDLLIEVDCQGFGSG
jgi:hypothetical protein